MLPNAPLSDVERGCIPVQTHGDTSHKHMQEGYLQKNSASKQKGNGAECTLRFQMYRFAMSCEVVFRYKSARTSFTNVDRSTAYKLRCPREYLTVAFRSYVLKRVKH